MMPGTLIFILILPGKPGKGMAEALDFLGGPLPRPLFEDSQEEKGSLE